MAQFNCPICHQGFEQKSRYERHMVTSHPQRAVSAADIETVYQGIEFPQSRQDLVEIARQRGDREVAAIVNDFDKDEFNDAAEIAREFGALRTHEEKPEHQPSKKGGRNAMKSPSAAHIAALFRGMDFPASVEDLKDHADEQGTEQDKEILGQFHDKTYRNMADVQKEFSAVT